MTSLASCCARMVNQNKWPTLLHDWADVTTRYITHFSGRISRALRFDFGRDFVIWSGLWVENCFRSQIKTRLVAFDLTSRRTDWRGPGRIRLRMEWFGSERLGHRHLFLVKKKYPDTNLGKKKFARIQKQVIKSTSACGCGRGLGTCVTT